MKKRIKLILVLLLSAAAIFSFSACGKSDDKDETTSAVSTTKTKISETQDETEYEEPDDEETESKPDTNTSTTAKVSTTKSTTTKKQEELAKVGDISPSFYNISDEYGGGYTGVVIKWGKVKNATGYEIVKYEGESEAGTFNISSKYSGLRYGTQDSGIYIKIRAYKSTNSGKIYGQWSDKYTADYAYPSASPKDLNEKSWNSMSSYYDIT